MVMIRWASALLLSGCWLSQDPTRAGEPAEPVPPDQPEVSPEPEPEPERETRIAVLVDSSQSMAVSDPPDPVTLRGRVQSALDELVAARLPEAALLVAKASSFVTVLTQCDGDGDGTVDHDCFTRVAAEASGAIRQLDANGLIESWSANVADLDAAVRADVAEHAAPATARWVVLVVTDEGGAIAEDVEEAAAQVAALRADLESLGAGFVLSAVVLDSPFGGAGVQVAAPLVEAGGGTVQRVARAQAVDLTLLVPGSD